MKRLLLAAALIAAPALAQPAPAPAGMLMGPALHVGDLAKSLRFYTEGLGMKVGIKMGPPERRETILGFGDPSQPGIILLSKPAATGPTFEAGHGYDRSVLRMTDLPAVVARLRSLGFTASDVHEVAMGYRMALATDPDGYKLELVESTRPR